MEEPDRHHGETARNPQRRPVPTVCCRPARADAGKRRRLRGDLFGLSIRGYASSFFRAFLTRRMQRTAKTTAQRTLPLIRPFLRSGKNLDPRSSFSRSVGFSILRTRSPKKATKAIKTP